MIAGLVLAGGLSSRFGSEKATAVLDGRSLLDHALDALAGCMPLAVSAPAGSGAAALAHERGLAVLADDPAAPRGPLAGVRAGLAWAAGQGAGWLAVVPCDGPGAPGDLVARLAGVVGAGPGAAAVSSSGPEPLHAIWRTDLLAVLDDALASGHPPVWRLQADLGFARVAFDHPFRNLNRPAG